MDRRSLASVLGLSEQPTTGEIRRARRNVAQRLHPDATGGEATLMSEINADCDRWIAEIRRGQPPATTATTRAQSPRPHEHDEPARPPAGPVSRPTFRASYAVATVVMIATITLLVAALFGPSVETLAAGALVGALGGAIYAVVLRLLARPGSSP